jgi:hypothetical protein
LGFFRSRLPIYLGGLALACAVILASLELTGNVGCWDVWNSTPCTRVLFIGNSYTSVNDLPSVFAKLARSGGRRVETRGDTQDGSTLANHADSTSTTDAVNSAKWNVVVLQEQSEIPAIPQLRQQQMSPAAGKLVTMIRGSGAQPLLFLTWAHRRGWPENGRSDYSTMQSAITDGYLAVAREQRAPVAPVGEAWRTLVGQEADPGLWQGDGSHPTTTGTYLAACVFYASIFRESPEGLAYRADLTATEALAIQKIAAATVLNDPPKWGMP